jgi:hypothetical protein
MATPAEINAAMTEAERFYAGEANARWARPPLPQQGEGPWQRR